MGISSPAVGIHGTPDLSRAAFGARTIRVLLRGSATTVVRNEVSVWPWALREGVILRRLDWLTDGR